MIDINVEVVASKLADANCDALLLGMIKNEKPSDEVLSILDKSGNIKIEEMIDAGEITGSFKEFTILHYKNAPFKRLVVIGLGKKEDYSLDRIRSISAKAARILRRIGTPKMTVQLKGFPDYSKSEVAQVVCEGVTLGLYKYAKDNFKELKLKPFTDLQFIVDESSEEKDVKAAVERGLFIANGCNLTRDLTNDPANLMNVEELAEVARNLAKKADCEFILYNYEEMIKKGMNGIIAVGKASEHKPCLVHIKYRRASKDSPIFSLVGKGVVFDTGGLNIKTNNSMLHMNSDMAGAASVLGVLYILSNLNISANVDFILPIAENSISSNSTRTGDVIKMYSGKTVEIINIDAEGRLILADALHYAREQGSDVLFDIATLTGAVIKALGFVATGVVSNNDALCDFAGQASQFTQEKIWRMPIFKEYEIQLKSICAEFRNLGDGGAGASVAALFLSYFVGNTPWIHFDIAGTGWIDELSTQYFHKSYCPKRGATGVGARLIFHMLEKLIIKCENNKEKLQEILK